MGLLALLDERTVRAHSLKKWTTERDKLLKAAWKALGAPRRAAPGQHEQLRRFPREVAISCTRLQPRLCSRIGAPPTPVVRSPPRGHATASRRRPPASTATCRPPSARLPATSVRTQAPSRFHHRRVIPRHGWRTRGRAVPSAQHPGRAAGEARGLEVEASRPGHDSRFEHSTKSIVRGVWLPAASAPERCVHRVKPVIPYFGH